MLIFFLLWSHEGGTDKILERLKNPETRKQIAKDYDRAQREHPEIMSLESLIPPIPAKRFGLKDRGTLEPNKAADIVIFDAEAIPDTASYDHPKSYAKGIEYVLVNGQLAVEKGNVTDKLAGRALPR